MQKMIEIKWPDKYRMTQLCEGWVDEGVNDDEGRG